jgi:hypothetical protein
MPSGLQCSTQPPCVYGAAAKGRGRPHQQRFRGLGRRAPRRAGPRGPPRRPTGQPRLLSLASICLLSLVSASCLCLLPLTLYLPLVSCLCLLSLPLSLSIVSVSCLYLPLVSCLCLLGLPQSLSLVSCLLSLPLSLSLVSCLCRLSLSRVRLRDRYRQPPACTPSGCHMYAAWYQSKCWAKSRNLGQTWTIFVYPLRISREGYT